MTVLHPRLDILPPAQRKTWPGLAPLRSLGWVLYGGTAVALRLGHRTSVDFDFFHERPLDLASVRSAVPALLRAAVLQDEANAHTCTLRSSRGLVKLSFFGNLTFGRIGQPEATADHVATVASSSDLLAHKLKVVLQRVEAKDYRDVAALLEAGVPLERGLAGATALFGKAFAPMECLRALSHFSGGDLADLDLPVRDTLLAAIRSPLKAARPLRVRSRKLGMLG